MENYYFSAKAYTTLVEELPDATLVDISHDVPAHDVLTAGLPFMQHVVKEKTIYREQYRSTLHPIPEQMETGPRDIRNFFEEVLKLSSN